MHSGRRCAAALILSTAAVCLRAAPPSVDVAGLLSRVAERVDVYFARAHSIICIETVRIQPLSNVGSFPMSPRELVYELRVSFEPSDAGGPPEASILRQLLKVNGRTPRPGDEPGCYDPKPVSLDPLAFLLAANQHEYVFTFKGSGRTGRRDAVMLDYGPSKPGPPEVKWKGDCVSISLPARTKGRVWIDTTSGDVLRIDEHVAGPFSVPPNEEERRRGRDVNSLIVDRADSTINYREVAFTDPDETMIVPESIDTTTMVRGSDVPWMHLSQSFSDYKRFVTGARIVQ